MNRYQSRITKTGDGDYYALVVRVDSDGSENVVQAYKGRYFKTLAAAEKSTALHIKKFH